MKRKIFIFLILITVITGCDNESKDLIEIIKSPNGEYEIRTYLHNCGATCDFGVSADLCDKNNKCKEIYYCYHERESFVYWLDDENIFINQKKLNVLKDNYHNIDYDNAFRLSNIDHYKSISLINKDNYEYKLNGFEADYISEKATSIFKFNKINIYDDYDFILRIINLKRNTTSKYFLKITDDKMYLISSDKMSELNKTDYEYIKKIIIHNDLYKFN